MASVRLRSNRWYTVVRLAYCVFIDVHGSEARVQVTEGPFGDSVGYTGVSEWRVRNRKVFVLYEVVYVLSVVVLSLSDPVTVVHLPCAVGVQLVLLQTSVLIR